MSSSALDDLMGVEQYGEHKNNKLIIFEIKFVAKNKSVLWVCRS